MSIDQLTKSQLILLAILVSFVSSVATGIVTVSLMEDAPPAITQTVNRIVERTVETVVPENGREGQAAGAATTVTETAVVRESDLIAAAVAAIEPSVVRLFKTGPDPSGAVVDTFVGMALVVSENGTLVADAATPDGSLKAVRHDGVTVAIAIATRKDGEKTVRVQAPLEYDGKLLAWQPAKFIATVPTPGQAVVAIGGAKSTRLGGGIVIGASSEDAVIETNIPLDSFVPGSPLLTADGIVGLGTAATRTGASGFLASSYFMLQNSDTVASP